MDKKLEEQVIYPKDLLFAALYRWKAAVVLGLMLALLLGGLQLLKTPAAGAVDADAQAAYEEALAEFEEEKAALKAFEEKYENEIAEQNRHLQDSVLFSLDPFAHYRGELWLYVATDYQVQPDQIYQVPDKARSLLVSYQAVLRSDAAVASLAESASLQWRQMYELYDVNYEIEAGALRVDIRHSDAAVAKSLLDQILALAKQQQPALSKSVGEHELQVLHQGVELVSDAELVNAANDAWAQLGQLEEARVNVQAKIGALVPPAQPQAGGGSMKKAVIFAVLGFVAGFAVVAVCAWFAHMESDKVYSARLLRIRTGIKVLGTLKATKFGLIDGAIRKCEGRDAADPADKATLLACDLHNRFPEGTILLTGSGSGEERKQLLQALCDAGVKAVDAGNILKDTQAVEALKQADAVVLAEKCGEATCTGVFQQMQAVEDYEKLLLGCVVLNG